VCVLNHDNECKPVVSWLEFQCSSEVLLAYSVYICMYVVCVCVYGVCVCVCVCMVCVSVYIWCVCVCVCMCVCVITISEKKCTINRFLRGKSEILKM
jgi:Ca2+/H+ antiporter